MSENAPTTLKHIADYLGLSISTVSRVLNGKAAQYRISTATQKRIHEAARELQFSPNQLARSLRLQKTFSIGLIIPDISNPFFASIAHYITSEARQKQYSVILSDTEENTGLEIEAVRFLQSRKVDGMIVSPVGISSAHLEKVADEHVPLVIVDRQFPGFSFHHIASDNFQGAFDAVDYLIQKGHRKIAVIQGIPETSPNSERIQGYRAALEKYQIPFDPSLVVGDSFREQNGYIETKFLLKKVPRPTAIFAVSNLIGLGAMHAIWEEGLSIPEHISLISFDEQNYSRFLATPMTTVAQQNAEMGQLAVKLLFAQIESNRHIEPTRILLPTKLIERQSVKAIA